MHAPRTPSRASVPWFATWQLGDLADTDVDVSLKSVMTTSSDGGTRASHPTAISLPL